MPYLFCQKYVADSIVMRPTPCLIGRIGATGQPLANRSRNERSRARAIWRRRRRYAIAYLDTLRFAIRLRSTKRHSERSRCATPNSMNCTDRCGVHLTGRAMSVSPSASARAHKELPTAGEQAKSCARSPTSAASRSAGPAVAATTSKGSAGATGFIVQSDQPPASVTMSAPAAQSHR